jgi:hypothetical protein
MTSSAEHDRGQSFGWFNRDLIASRKGTPHGSLCGGEDRLWVAPEGGPHALPEGADTRAFRLVRRTKQSAAFETEFPVANSAGTSFQLALRREVRVLEPKETLPELDIPPAHTVGVVAYETRNVLVNLGRQPWRKDTGLLSIWIRGMFTPSPVSTIILPIKAGSELELGPKVTTHYFGPIPSDRLRVTENLVYLRGDGQFRSKVGINPRRSRKTLASYDEKRRVLTLIQFSQSEDSVDYFNSVWEREGDPYAGEVATIYNDGPVGSAAEAVGRPFYQFESFSPAIALGPGASIEHTHRTIHLTGIDRELDRIMRVLLGVRLEHVKTALPQRAMNQAF